MSKGCLYRRKKKLPDGTLVEVGPYWMRYYRNGTPFSESTHTDKKTLAQQELNKRMGDLARGVRLTSKSGRVKFDELIENLCNEYRANGRKSLEDVIGHCKRHLLPFFGGRRASTITTADINRYVVMRKKGLASPEEIRAETRKVEAEYASAVATIQARKDVGPAFARKELGRLKREFQKKLTAARSKSGAANGTINRELSALKRAYTLAEQGGLLVRGSTPHFHKLQENNVRTGFFEFEQFTAIYLHLPSYVQPVAAVAYITGWRTLSELLPLEWRQVDFTSGTLRLDPGSTKNGDGRVFPMTQELRAVLLEQRARTEDLQKEHGVVIPYVFHIDGKPFKSYRRAWKTACTKACLPGRIPHDFRRTAVRNLVRAGISETIAMRMTGHRTRSVFDRYDIVSQRDLEEAARKLEQKTVTKIVTLGDSGRTS